MREGLVDGVTVMPSLLNFYWSALQSAVLSDSERFAVVLCYALVAIAIYLSNL